MISRMMVQTKDASICIAFLHFLVVQVLGEGILILTNLVLREQTLCSSLAVPLSGYKTLMSERKLSLSRREDFTATTVRYKYTHC